MKIVGVRKVEYTAKDGAQVKGYTVHATYTEKGTDGLCCDNFFVSEKKADGWVPEVGETVELMYNKYGKIDSVKVA